MWRRLCAMWSQSLSPTATIALLQTNGGDGDMTREATVITELRGELGDRLATFRKAAGMTQAQLATAAYCDRTRIAHLEKGRGAADERFWRTLDDLLSADGLLVKAEQDVRLAQREQEDMQRSVGLAVVHGRIDGQCHVA